MSEVEECQRSSAKLFMLFQNMLHHLRLRSLQLAPPALGKVQVKVVRQSSPLVRAEPNSQADILASPRLTNKQSVALRLEGREWVGNQLRPNGGTLNKGYPRYDFGGKREDNGPEFLLSLCIGPKFTLRWAFHQLGGNIEIQDVYSCKKSVLQNFQIYSRQRQRISLLRILDFML